MAATPSLDRHIFALMWQPTIAAVSVVLDHADDPQTVQHALDGLLLAARLAAFHRVDEVMDNMVASLSKFAAVLDPVNSKAALTFGENEKARRATHTMFTIANRYYLSRKILCLEDGPVKVGESHELVPLNST